MQRAGAAAAKLALHLLSPAGASASALVIAGPGNNGGDALEAAHLLAGEGVNVTVLLFADPARLPADAQQSLARARNSAALFPRAAVDSVIGQRWDLVVDGLFGIGLTRPITGELRDLIEAINALACPVLALDVPSGLDADSGGIVGNDSVAIKASHTITFIGDKPGLHTHQGRDHAGEVHVDDLGIDPASVKPAHIHLNSVESFAEFLRRRPHNSHKGSYGDVIIVGGAHGMSGAPILAARAAAMCGAGRVFAAFIGEAPAYDCTHPELMCRRAEDMDLSSGVVVAGPGLSTSRSAHDVLSEALHGVNPLVLDADALNLIATEPGLQQRLTQRGGSTVLTPHPLEAARLLQTSTQEVQSDRLSAARDIARRFNAIVVLKGSGSIIARVDGQAAINTTGNPALATAGTGDVLSGICGALLAQSFAPWNAALAATWLHGQAADTLAAQGIGPIGMTASELIPAVRTLLNQLTEQYARRNVAR
ncbi:MAG TPA: NAD(P)H-hydrate dehydratase [Noviherbaspirillum sp.]